MPILPTLSWVSTLVKGRMGAYEISLESESWNNALELRVAPPAFLDSCSALVNFSTRFRVSLGDKSPSSPHLRLDRSGGHMRAEVRVFAN